MTIKMIIAVDQGNSIGWSDGRLPWKIPPDMQRFKDLTTGHIVMMGRTTYQSLKRPDGLPNRRNVVLTRRPYSEVRGQFGNVDIISSLDWINGESQRGKVIWIIGGAQVYAEAIEKKIVDEIYLTQVHTLSGGDVILPIDLFSWKLFVLRERARGVNWDTTFDWDVPVPPSSPKISYITFKKTT